MKRFSWTLLLIVFLLASGCGSAETATPIPVISLDIPGDVALTRVTASAVVVPVQESNLSFVISGQVKEIVVNEGQVVQKGENLVVLDTKELEYAVEGAQATVRAAELEAEIQRFRRKDFTSSGIKYSSGPRELIEVADARLKQTQAALESTKAKLAQGILLAPFEGTVVSINVVSGEYIATGQTVLVIANLSDLQVETTDLSELNVNYVQIDQPVTVFVEALNKELPGKVSAISPISDTIGGDVVFKVTVELDQQPGGLLWGMSADVDIDLE
jgi:RND family efflux transporter MFP subunit